MTTRDNKHIAIIGASYAGLALANGLLNKKDNNKVTLFEGRHPLPVGSIVGNVTIISQHVLKELGMPFRASERIPEAELFELLRQPVQQSINYGHVVQGLHQAPDGRIVLTVRQHDSVEELGPYDFVVAANGVWSKFRASNLQQVAVIGDARWAQDSWDFGLQRIRGGANQALEDGLDLGRLLCGQLQDLGKFSARFKQLQVRRRRALWAAFWCAAIAVVLRRTLFESQTMA